VALSRRPKIVVREPVLTLDTNTVRKNDLGMVGKILIQIMPVALVVPNPFAMCTDRQEAL